ncbi:putative F-box domain, FBD domain, leucine-rich repeat domain, L domain-containing protein [Lupinus albus]|uniref:Putative F-box domain, FBD domain, leucine-rich repeat domain, L domain-containing protein n=1 Tax=Lupinus albus TaxID=3870 RepID=A0A6A4QX24_LUPAL|nr:putative F-box domain, FBD domain, leucine-rich repeat domain, L domain-containing protein [Lupinus albus]
MVDRISLLPDAIICHILSFLHTKDAVSTSVLSKKWYPLWRFVPNVDLSDESVPDTDEKAYILFREFVLSVLLLRGTSQQIKRFTLKHHHYDNPNLNKWVSVVLQRGVEHLQLEMCTDCYYHKLPTGIFSCRTLVVLNLDAFYVNVNDVSSVELPLLKILHLGKFKFTEYRFLIELISGCPNLEDFVAIDVQCEKYGSKGKLKSITKLKRATILDCDFEFPLEALYNVEYLNLNIREVSPHYNDMPAFYNLTEMKLFFYEYRWQQLVELLNHCPKLQILKIHMSFGMEHDENWACPRFVPECVLLHLRECSIYEYGGMEGELQFARYILQNTRVLQTMKVHSFMSSSSDKKFQLLQELSLCPRGSATSKLVFI